MTSLRISQTRLRNKDTLRNKRAHVASDDADSQWPYPDFAKVGVRGDRGGRRATVVPNILIIGKLT